MDVEIYDTFVSVNGIQIWPPSWVLVTAIASAAVFLVAALVVAASLLTRKG
jgi:hypothetical protein